MKKATKNIFKGIIILIILTAIVILARFAWAKYMSKVEGNASADIAHFSFTISEQKSDGLTIDLAQTRLPNDTSSVEGTTVAPGTKGALAFDVNANESDVSLEYDINIDITQVPQNLIFYSDSDMKNAIYHSENTISIKGYFSSTEDKRSTNYIYWQWPLETGLTQEEIDKSDETDSLSMGDLVTIDINVIGQQAKTNPLENGHVINGYGNSEIMTKTVLDAQYGELPETRRSGYTFNGWYTNKTGGERVSADAVVGGNVTCYAQWSANPYTVTINPNGGSYNSQTENIQLTRDCGTLLGLEEPTREGYTFAGWSLSGSGSMQRGIPSGGGYARILKITSEEKRDCDGSIYNKYTMNITNNSSTDRFYGYIHWPPYQYELNHEYKISAYIRANVLELNYIKLRNSAFVHDIGSPGFKEKDIRESNDFIEYSVTRTFSENKYTQDSIEYDVSPRIELYCAIAPNSTGILDIDIKNISVYDVTAGKYVTNWGYEGYMYKFGSGNATLTAKWTKNN